MNTRNAIATIFALVFCTASATAATPLGDAFTYQGRLTDNNLPANGLYDFSFTLHDVANGAGGLVVDPVQVEDVPVENGVFTVQLDFGSGMFTGEQRWLAVGVRDGASTGAFDLLAGRQELTSTPYAHFAREANPRSVIASITGFNGGIGNFVAGGVNAPWVFAGPAATISVTTGQRITAQAVGSFAPGLSGTVITFSAICLQPSAGGAIGPLNGGVGVRIFFEDGVGVYRQLSSSQSALITSSGDFKVGLCIRNTSNSGVSLTGDMVDGWVMVSN